MNSTYTGNKNFPNKVIYHREKFYKVSDDNIRLYAFKEAGLTSFTVFKLTLRQSSNSFHWKEINIRN